MSLCVKYWFAENIKRKLFENRIFLQKGFQKIDEIDTDLFVGRSVGTRSVNIWIAST